MPREARPCWHKGQQLWYCKIGDRGPDGRRRPVYMSYPIGEVAPPKGEKDEAGAFRWVEAYRIERSRQATEAARPTVYGVLHAYLQWAEAEVKAGDMAAAHYRARTVHLRHFARFIGADRPIDELIPDDHGSFLDDMRTRGGYSEHYLRGMHQSVMAVLNWAARPIRGRTPARMIASNPLAGVKPPVIGPAPDRYADAEAFRQFLWWAIGRARQMPRLARRFERNFVRLLLFESQVGCRPGEACRLRWDHIDWAEGTADLSAEHKTRKKGKGRVLYLPDRTLRLLHRIRSQPGHHPVFVFTHRVGKRQKGYANADHEAGEPWSDSTAAGYKLRKLRDAAIDAGIEIEAEGPRRLVAYLHRHTAITDAIEHGMTEEHAAEIYGNSPDVLRTRYQHLRRARSAERVRDLDAKRRGR